jgi:hypothetical protein
LHIEIELVNAGSPPITVYLYLLLELGLSETGKDLQTGIKKPRQSRGFCTSHKVNRAAPS